MEGKETVEGILGRGTKDSVSNALDRGPTADFLNGFEDEVGYFLDRVCSGMSVQAATTTTAHEGPFGILPPPAKRQIAKEILAGLPISPLKMVEETVTEAPERTVDQLAFHVVAEVNPLTAVNSQEILDTVNILQAVTRELQLTRRGARTWRYENKSKPAIRIQKAQGVLYLIQRSATGNYSFNTFALDYPADIQRAQEAYRENLAGVFTVTPADKPKDDMIAHEVICAQVKSAIGQNSGGRKLSLPIIVYPKRYKDESASYSLTRWIEDNTPFMAIDKNHGLILVERRRNETTKEWQIVSVGQDYGVPMDLNL